MGITPGFSDFTAKRFDVGIDRSIRECKTVAPNAINQLFSRKNAMRIIEERGK
jgi:hypothetical protein